MAGYNAAKTELLCPAGDFESLNAAILYGADAVYLAGKGFGLRKAAANFENADLKKAVEISHRSGVKVYVACNIIPHNEDIESLPEFLEYVKAIGADAVIVSDLGTLALAKKHAAGVPVHISVQAGITNYATASEFYRLGASRVILSREISLEEIKTIRKNTPEELELEAFVHGAICMSHSGRCLLSNYLTGRDANRGDCAQPCRWGYSLVEEKRKGEHFPVFEDEGGTYILNSRDLNLIEYLDQFIEEGVLSLKIEGRAKSAYYAAVVTNAYKNAIQAYYKDQKNYRVPEWVVKELEKISHREYSTGFYFGVPKTGQCTDYGGYVREYDVAAVVTGYENGYIKAIQRNRFFKGDSVEILEPGGNPPFEMVIEQMTNSQGEPIEVAPHAAMPVNIKFGKRVANGAIIRKKRN